MKPHILPPFARSAADAKRFAGIVHGSQSDKAGKPYVAHLERVARRVQWSISKGALSPVDLKFKPVFSEKEQDAAVQIAWLHDVIEDTEYTADDLRREGFSAIVIDGVCAVTRPATARDYSRFIDLVVEYASLPALIVKLADVEDNSDPARLAMLDEATRVRLLKKYEPAKERLRVAIAGRGS